MTEFVVISAKQKLDQILQLCLTPTSLYDTMMSIYQHVCGLDIHVFKRFNCLQRVEILGNDFDQQIEEVLDAFDCLMDSYDIPSSSSSDFSRSDGNNSISILSQQLLPIEQQLQLLSENIKRKNIPDTLPSFAVVDDPTIIYPCVSKSKLVGLEDEQNHLVDIFTKTSTGHHVTSIVGMAGIGKTTLARQIFNHPTIIRHFNIRIMVRAGPTLNFDAREFLLRVLSHVDLDHREDMGVDELCLALKNYLGNRRYLLVVDDVWSDQVWRMVHHIFPRGHNGSRIIITTRLSDVAFRASEFKHVYPKQFLNCDKGWDLLRKILFNGTNESCSSELEKIGRKIAHNCEGLPLVVVLIGKLLSKIERTVEKWKEISEDENPLKIGVDENSVITKSLNLSYEMLPSDLKPSFLYMGVFPGFRIMVNRLYNLWSVEGLVPETHPRNPYRYMYVLVSNSMVLARKMNSLANDFKTVEVHVVFRNLCISRARKEEFCFVLKKYSDIFLDQGKECTLRLCMHNNAMLGIKEVHSYMESISSLHSLLCFGPLHQYQLRMCLNFKLLRVLNVLRIRFHVFPDQVVELVSLSYLAITYDGEVPKSISKLRDLCFLIIGRYRYIKNSDSPSYFPAEIWNLKWLRHLQCMGKDLPDPNGHEDCILEHLSKLSGVSDHSCTRGVLARLPFLKKLGIRIDLSPEEVANFSFVDDVARQLFHLESFKCVVTGINSQIEHSIPVFPANILKLTLSGCGFAWENMTTIENLESLQVLKLQCNAFRGPIWSLPKTGFFKLRYLLMEDLDIKEWRTFHNSFPNLQQLIIRHCYRLQKMPTGMEGNMKLKMVEVEDCSLVVANWGKKQIKDTREVCVRSSWSDERKPFRQAPSVLTKWS